MAFEETRTSLNPSWEVGLASQVLKRATWSVSYGGAGTTGLCSVGQRPTWECSSRRPASVPQDPAALTAGCTLGRGPHCPFPLGLLDQGCCGLRTKGLPLTQQTGDGAHRAPRQTRCPLSVNSASHFIFKIQRETSKVFQLVALLGRKASSTALWGGGRWEGENAD